MHYLPTVHCARCDKPVERIVREHKPKENTRHVFAVCHGERQEVQFAVEPGARVVVFEAKL